MKMKYIKPVILCCYDIDTSIIAATARVTAEGVGDTGQTIETPEAAGSGEEASSTKGTSWNLWEDEGDDEENSFY